MTFGSTKCRHCGIEFRYPLEFGLVKYCSALCRVQDNGVTEGPELKGCFSPRYYSSRRRRRMLRGDKIDPWVVYTFYEWTCCLCNESIDPELMMPDPLSATIEHIIPLSKNGRHVWDNVAPAHKGCNEDNVHHAIIA